MSAWWRRSNEPRPLQAARDAAEARARFVYVNEDGSARELNPEECAYLATGFHPADGARPYIKSQYNARTPDGRLVGFLERSALPVHIEVNSASKPVA